MSAVLCPLSLQTVFDAAGRPLVGAACYVFGGGTLAAATVYADAGLTTALPHPVKTTGSGRLPPMYLGVGSFRFRIFDTKGGLLDDVDGIQGAQSSAATPFGTPVYASAADVVKRAQANAKATSGLAGLVYDSTIAAGAVGNIAMGGVMVGTTAQWDAVVTGQTGGLVFNTLYFLDAANPGKMVNTAPSTAGQTNTFIGRGLSSTELEVNIAQPILL